MAASHKFTVGQRVELDAKIAAKLRGPFEITRVLPSDGAPSQTYRIKSANEPFERVAKEYEIIAID